MSILEQTIKTTNDYISQMPKEQRKQYGQFFTSRETAMYMAGLFDLDSTKQSISILDPGAGSGILSIAVAERLLSVPAIESIKLVCYENDANVLELLNANLETLRCQASKKITYTVITDNYLLSQQDDYNNTFGANHSAVKYDIVIGNPPYKKIPKEASEAKAMPDVCHGAPNLYFLFAAMSLFNLADGGQMVYIIPRSWTSGAYFAQFRSKFLRDGALEHIHLFASRNKVFDREQVLQETMIIKVRKTRQKPAAVTITTTRSNADFSSITAFEAPYSAVVSGKANYVYLATDEHEVKTLDAVNRWHVTLPDLGIKIKTGLTVDFRNREALRDYAEDGAVPLYYAQHVKDGKVAFPIGKKAEYIKTEKKGLLQKNTNYLFVKRFTAKEEPRRLQCGVYLAIDHPGCEISTHNKLNFVCGLNEDLSASAVYGLYVLFNSTLYDDYYRILNGSTQVNATEINSMPVPPLETIEAMGQALEQSNDMSVANCDCILGRFA